MSTETRRAKLPERNGKGQCVVKVGSRTDYRVFKFSRSVSDKKVEQRREAQGDRMVEKLLATNAALLQGEKMPVE